MTTTLFDTQFALNIGPWEKSSLVSCLTQMTRLGYNGIEVTDQTFQHYGDRVEIFREIADDVGIQVISYELKMDFDQVVKDATLLDHFTRLAGFIQAIGGKYVIVEQGLRPDHKVEEKERLASFERFLTDFSGICSDCGVELIFHPTPDSFISGPDIMNRVVELIYPLGCRICFDISNTMLMGVHPIQFLKKYFDAIKIVHMNDMKILKGKKAWVLTLPEPCMLGDGKVDLRSIWLVLQAMEYKGWIVVECPDGTPLKEGLEKTTGYITKDMEVFLTNTL